MQPPFGESEFWLLDVFGRAVRVEQFLFIACALEFEIETPQFPSSEFATAGLPRIATCWSPDDVDCDWQEDAHVFWCRSRVMALFGYQPVFSQTSWVRNLTFEASFLAIDTTGSTLSSAPFVLTDWDGEAYDEYAGPDFVARLGFSKTVSSARRRLIASRFWSLLLRNPFNVCEYGDFLEIEYNVSRVSFDRGGVVLSSMSGGDETGDDEDDEEVQFDTHAGYGYFTDRWCLDCGGLGEEYIRYPVRQTCESCNGAGVVHW